MRQSAQRGILGSQTRWAVAVDGSPLPSGGNGRGHRICGCKKEDPCIHRYRSYSDPGARIGWFADRISGLAAVRADHRFDLPD